MKSSFQEYKLSTRCEIKSSKRVFAKEYITDGIPFVRSKDVIDKSLGIFKNYDLFISHERFRELKRLTGSPEKGDILLSAVGNRSGKCYVVNDEGDFYFKDGNIIWISKFDEIDSYYLSYFFNSDLGQRKLQSVMIGSAQKALTIDSIRNLRINLPNLQMQKGIANVLRTLDKKIEINKKTNENLENIAKALFKSWFIDFDPVRAKTEGRSTGLPDEISDLFPDSFEDSELGVIPKGWEIKSLPNIFDFLEGPGIRNWQYTNDETGIRFINIRCINNGDLNVETSNRITEEEALGKYKHFVLLEDDIVVSTSGTLGKYAIVRKEHLPLNLNTSVIRFRPIENQSTFSFLYGFIETKLQYELEIRASGSVQRNFGPMHLREIELLLPNINLLKVHEKYVEDLFKKRKLNLGENNLLSNLRDNLLPKLIAGELRIPDVEKMIEKIGI